MKKGEIPRATAKEELARLDKVLTSPYLLIGGLAVQQYVPSRNSKDIDLICDFKTVQSILEQLYPTKEWKTTNETNDDYRPAYRIKHRHSEEGEIIFGPKVSERGAYEFLDWNELQEGAREFCYLNERLQNILVPQPHALAYSKLVSFAARNEINEDKIKQDLKDFSDLTNHDEFNLASFWNLLNRHDKRGKLREGFRERSVRYSEIVKQSCLHGLTELFFGSRYMTLEQLSSVEGKLPNLSRVMVVAHRVEKPEGELGKAVEHNFAKNVEYLFLISASNAAAEKKKGYFKFFEVYHQMWSPRKRLLDIKALPFDWDDYPIIFYHYQKDNQVAVVAFRGSEVSEGITKFYERVPAEYAHTIAKSLLADAPKDIDPTEIPGREEFESGKNLDLDGIQT